VAEDIAAAMREEYITDRNGRRVRLLHRAAVKSGHGEQLSLAIVANSSLTWIATTNAHPDAEPVQIVFDFTMDLAELEAADEAA